MSDERCNVCGRPVTAPYRRIVDGKIIEGCIDASHDGHLYGNSLAWHMRPAAKQFRASLKRKVASKKTPSEIDREIDEWTAGVSERAARERSTRRGRRYGGVRPGGKRDV